MRFQRKQVKAAMKGARLRSMSGMVFVDVNCPVNVSEIGEALLEEYPEVDFARIYFDVPDSGTRVVSLRSRKGGFNVADLAKELGGGGHQPAAGYAYDHECPV